MCSCNDMLLVDEWIKGKADKIEPEILKHFKKRKLIEKSETNKQVGWTWSDNGADWFRVCKDEVTDEDVEEHIEDLNEGITR